MEQHDKAEFLATVRSLYDIYVGNYENEPVLRNQQTDASNLHLVAGVFVYNPSTREFLVQQRSASKKTYPEHFTDSASGHIMARKDMSLATIKQEMCRELSEEMGVEAKPSQLSLWTLFQDPAENEIMFIFVACVNTTRTRLDLAEVSERSGWYSASKLRSMLESERFVKVVVGLWDTLLQNEPRFGAFVQSLAPWQTYWKSCDGLRKFKEWESIEKGKQESNHDDRVVPLFLGRFQPFHRGHLRCLEHIRKQARNVIIGIGSAQYSRDARNPLTFTERRDLIQQSIKQEKLGFDNLFFVPIPDVHNEHLWMQNVKILLGDSIEMYTNNDWVRGLASGAGISVAEKMAFEMDTYNGSRVRELVREGGHWEALVPDPQFLKKRGLVSIIKESK
jgi:nicotinamide-nucleotide adenylyltransferase